MTTVTCAPQAALAVTPPRAFHDTVTLPQGWKGHGSQEGKAQRGVTHHVTQPYSRDRTCNPDGHPRSCSTASAS